MARVFHFGTIGAQPPAAAEGSDPKPGESFYAMEFVEGESLEARLRESGPLSPLVALKVGLQVAHAWRRRKNAGWSIAI